MTLQHEYGATGAVSLFPFSFAIDAASDLEVRIDDIEQNAGFVVRGAGGNDGGSVLFDAAPANGAVITLRHRGRVSVSPLDSASGHLADKLMAGDGVTLTATADADGRQRLVVAAVAPGGDLYLKKDATPEEIAAFLAEYGVATNTLDNVDPQTGRTRLDVLSEQQSDDRYVKKIPVGTEAEQFRAAYDVAKADLGNVDPQTALDRIGAQAHDADLDWLSTNITPAGKALLDDADAAAQRATLGVHAAIDVYTKAEANDTFADQTLSNVDAATVRDNLGLGSAALLDAGSAAGNVVVLDNDGLVPQTLLPASGSTGSSPTGAVVAFAGASAPDGWLICDGSAVSRSTYDALFAVIGTAYGVGDGSTTFTLPDMRGRTVIGAGTGTGLTMRSLGAKVGAETHTLSMAEMPSHSHVMRRYGSYAGYDAGNAGPFAPSGSFYLNDTASAQSTESTGSSAAHNNMQPSLALTYIIKI